MRQMTKGNIVLNVVEHIILRNMWEYYIVADEPDTHAPDPDVAFALVMGDYTEMGSVYLPEIQPHVLSRTADLSEIMPADGYEWESDSVEIRHIIGQNTTPDDWTT